MLYARRTVPERQVHWRYPRPLSSGAKGFILRGEWHPTAALQIRMEYWHPTPAFGVHLRCARFLSESSPSPAVGSVLSPPLAGAVFRGPDDPCSANSSSVARPCAASESLSPAARGPGCSASQTSGGRATTRTGDQLPSTSAGEVGDRGRSVAAGGRGSQGGDGDGSEERCAGESRGERDS